MNQNFKVDDSRWPLLILTLRGEGPDWERYFDEIRKCNARKSPYMVINDVTDLKKMPGPAERKMIADFVTETTTTTHCKAWAIVSDTVVMRSILTAMRWLTKATEPYPTEVFGTQAKAEEWLRQVYAESMRSAS